MKPRGLGPLAALSVLAVVLNVEAALLGRAFFERDVHMNWHPQIEAFVRSVAAGSWPVWNPWLGFGQPLLASHVQVLYPFTWLNLVVPPVPVYTLLVLVHLVLGAMGMRALALRLSATPGAALFAAALWTGGGPLLSFVNGWNHFVALAWLPWMVRAAEDAWEGTGSAPGRALALWSLAGAAQVVAGSPDMFLFSSAVVGTHLLARFASGPRQAAQLARLTVLAAAGSSGALALSAAYWLPLLEVTRRASRWSQDYGSTWSVTPALLVELLVPWRWNDLPLRPEQAATLLDGREPLLRSMYLGLATVPFVLAGLLGPGDRRALRRALALLVVLAVLFALGRYTPVAASVGTLLPPFRMVRFPVKAVAFAGYAWALLAAWGFDAWAAGRPGSRARRGALAFGAAAAGLAACVAVTSSAWAPAFLAPPGDALTPLLRPALLRLGLSGALTLGVALLLVRRWGRHSVPAAASVAVLDLVIANRDVNRTAPTALFRERPPLVDLARRDTGGRVFVEDYAFGRPDPADGRRYTLARRPAGWDAPQTLALALQAYVHPPTSARWGLLGSFDHDLQDLYPRPVDALVRAMRADGDPARRRRFLQRAAVTHVATLHEKPWTAGLTLERREPGLFVEPVRLFSVPDARPRAYVVSGARSVTDDDALALLASASFDDRHEVLLEPGSPAAPPLAEAGSARLLAWTPDHVRVETSLGTAGYLVLLEAHDPGWRATVDGAPAPLLRANVAFRAVPVPAGRHTVEMIYRPRALLWGLVASALSSAVLVATLLRLRGRSR